MNPNLEKLLESSVLNEETKAALVEAWEAKLTEAREEIASELREEFANRYEHDKALFTEAADKMISEALKEEIAELAEDKKAIKEAKAELKKAKDTMIEKVFSFINKALVEEIREFKTERKQVNEGLVKMNRFVQSALKEELTDFQKDRNALTEQRIMFERTKKDEIAKAKKMFVETATKVSEKVIREALTSELTQLRTDLQESKKKMFGAKLFEAFATEFMNSHYNEKSEVKKLQHMVESLKKEASELRENVHVNQELLAEAKEQAKRQKELRERSEILGNLLGPLGKDHRKVMSKLLEHVDTNKLQENFKKNLPLVLKEDNNHKPQTLTENINETIKTPYDGNREEKSNDDLVRQLRKLSGIVR